MHVRWITALALCAAGQSLSGQAPTLDSAAAQKVAQLLASFDETGSGRGAAAAEQRAALFSDNAIVVNAFGLRVEGRDSLSAFWKRLYGSGTFGSSRVEPVDREQRILARGLVLVDHVERITGQRALETGRELPPRTIHITLLLQRQAAGDWRIVYYRAGDVREWPPR